MNFAGMIYTGICHWHIIRLGCHSKNIWSRGRDYHQLEFTTAKPKLI